MKRIGFLVLSAVFALPVAGYAAELYEPVEWTFANPSFSGNPYELIATATFSHLTASDIVTELYYDGGDTWKLRFTGTATGEWSFRTSSQDPDLDGLTGTVEVIDNPGSPGFITKFGGGTKWGRTGSNQAFVPQLLMFPMPDVYHRDPSVIDQNLEIFFGDHGFNGFHTAAFGRWFDINKPRYDNIPSDPNPDPRTFVALENLIRKTYAAGGVVHIWAWGDEQQHLTPIKWGINGAVDRRLQRYIAARLGPLPGWSMGYGFDLDEWVSASELREWRDYMQAHLGWFHFLGGRPAGPNSGTDHSDFIDWNEPLDYSSYEHHRPTYQVYVEALRNVSGQPVMSEDRFRVRPVQREKDYTLADTRRGLWISTMAGGVANIWGYQIPIQEDGSSNPYPNATELLTNGRFWRDRFKKNFVRANGLTDGFALRRSNSFYVFYRENRSSITMDLSGMDGPRRAVAVDTQRAYEEIPLGIFAPGSHRFEAPYRSDWAVAVGDPAPDGFVENDLGLIDRESGLFRVNVTDGDTRVTNIGGRDARRNDVPSSDRYIYLNVVGSYAFEGDRPEVEISIDYYDAGNAILRLQYDSFSAPYTTHADVVQLTNTNTWKQRTWTVPDAFFGNRQNGQADFRIHRLGEGPFYLDVIRVSTPAVIPPGPADNPSPANGSTNVGVDTDLQWSPGAGATSHDLYFGTSDPPPFQRNQTSTQFDPGTLTANTTYFWRVDEVNAAGTTPGELWSFTTGDAVLVPTLHFKEAGTISIDGRTDDWDLAEFTSPVRAGEMVAGDIALTGFDQGVLYFGGRATRLALPTDASDHTAKVYGRHDATHIYFLVRVDDDDMRAPHGVDLNWANDCVEFYLDPAGNGGSAPLSDSTSDIQLVIDAANQRNVYVTTMAYTAEILNAVQSAVTTDGTGWWLEVQIDKDVLNPGLPAQGRFGVDFNFRDNDNNNDPNLSTVYTWSDFEQSGSFPSKIPDRWGDAQLPSVSPPPLPAPASQPSPVDGAIDVPLGVDLSWTAGSGAVSHDVYFGLSNPPSFQINQTATRFDPGPLMTDTTYFWRIDEVNASGTTPGPTWTFTTSVDAPVAALNIKEAGAIAIDGSAGDWNLSEFTTVVRGGDVIAGDIALVGFDQGTLYFGGRATHLSLPTSAADHTAKVYGRHDGTHLYFLVRVDDDDMRAPHGVETNWANDCVEFYLDPGGDGGSAPLSNSSSDIQLVIDVANQRNVYVTADAYRAQILSGVQSAVSTDATGWWLEVRIEKTMLDPDLPNEGSFGLDFNFRDNDSNNDPNRTTVYTWNDTEQSGSFPSKIPDRWGEGLLVPVAVELASQVGLNVHIPSNDILDDVALNLGVRWIRVDFDWFRIEPEQGVFRWAATDRILQRAEELGLEVLAVLSYTPPWASPMPADPRISDPPASVDYWTDFVGQAVTRYRGRIRYWQFWNEPNVAEFWAGSMAQYRLDILERGARLAKEVDPSMQTVGPGLATLGNWRSWFTELMQSKDDIDVINHHIYRNSGRDAIFDLERDLPFQPSLRTLMRREGVEDKPFWLTETGRRAEEGNQLDYYQDVIAALPEKPWVKKVFFFHYWDGPGQGDGGFGIVNEDFSPKPAYHFLQTVLQPWVMLQVVAP